MDSMRVLMKAAASLPIALLATCLVAACGSPGASPSASPSAPTSPAPSAAALVPGCELAPAALVKAHLGLTVSDPVATTTTKVTTCAYAIGSNPYGVLIRFQVGQDSASFATGRAGFPATANVSGLGDEAYSSVANLYTTLVARKGTTGILITSRATFVGERSLMVVLLSKV